MHAYGLFWGGRVSSRAMLEQTASNVIVEDSRGVIYCGDALDVLRALPDNSVNLIATDPPYFKVKGDAWDWQWNTPAQFLAWIGELCDQWQRILKPNGSLYVFASPKMAHGVEAEVRKRFHVLNAITWSKPVGRSGGAEKEALRSFFPEYERIIFAEHYGADNMAKGEAGYEAKCDELRWFVFEPLRAYLDDERKRAGLSREDVRAEFGRRLGTKGKISGHFYDRAQWMLPTQEHYAWLRNIYNASGGDYLQRDYDDLRREYENLRRPFTVTADVPYTDVWTFKTVSHYPGKHPCEKPADLMAHIVKASSRCGDVVLDCFIGSGTTLHVAALHDRRFIGIDRDRAWCLYSAKRLSTPKNVSIFSA